MSGLFLNFYQIELEAKEVEFFAKDYNEYPNKSDFIDFRDRYPDYFMYRYYNDILVWNNNNETPDIEDLKIVKIDLSQQSYVFSKVLEYAIIDYLRNNLLEKSDILTTLRRF